MGASLRKYLVAGLLVWLPLAITVWVLTGALDVVNGVFGALLSALALELWAKVATTGATASTPSATEAAGKA